MLGVGRLHAVAFGLGVVLLVAGVGAVLREAGRPDAGPGSGGTDASADAPLRVLQARDWDPGAPPNLTHAPPFPLEDGQRPTREQATGFANRYASFKARGNEGLDKLRAEGHLSGNGTPDRPYVLERFYVEGSLSIESANRSLVLREGYVAGTLRLNYAGESLYVHHVYAKDLRVNENVKRNGTNTGGLFHDNAFAFVGQIRHFVGTFRDNAVGPRPADAVEEALGDTGLYPVPPKVVFNFDGFQAADVHHNTFEGLVDVKLHGHNHADCFACRVHDHHDEAEFPPHGWDTSALDPAERAVVEAVGFQSRHSVRYASLAFHENLVRVEHGVALRYNDRNHAGDDRTANSEPNERLDDAHLHFQDVTFARNRLEGGGFLLDVFNAKDERHPLPNRGILRLLENHASVAIGPVNANGASPAPIGFDLGGAEGLDLVLAGNQVEFRPHASPPPGALVGGLLAPAPEPIGVTLRSIDRANLSLDGNTVASGTYGVFARDLSTSVQWWLLRNDFRTTHAWRGSDVGQPPHEED